MSGQNKHRWYLGNEGVKEKLVLIRSDKLKENVLKMEDCVINSSLPCLILILLCDFRKVRGKARIILSLHQVNERHKRLKE